MCRTPCDTHHNSRFEFDDLNCTPNVVHTEDTVGPSLSSAVWFSAFFIFFLLQFNSTNTPIVRVYYGEYCRSLTPLDEWIQQTPMYTESASTKQTIKIKWNTKYLYLYICGYFNRFCRQQIHSFAPYSDWICLWNCLPKQLIRKFTHSPDDISIDNSFVMRTILHFSMKF